MSDKSSMESGQTPALGLEEGDKERLAQALKTNRARGTNRGETSQESRLSAEECQQANDMADRGVSGSDIGAEFGYSHGGIHRHLDGECNHGGAQ